ncbi:MAG TPA: SRPBCC family protein [Pyrinomonadaceae bacterium]|nr:SRPBCC family protein [Pyrinomonadaceae bacterium]
MDQQRTSFMDDREGATYMRERSQPGLPTASAKRLAKGLAWFSFGLGFAELLAPRAVAKIAGVSNEHTGLIRLYGLREIAAGVTILASPAAGVWSRVAGDALDLASLGMASRSEDSNKGMLAFATANVAAVTALDLICARQLTANGNHGIHASGTCIVNRSPEEVYTFWRDFQNLPRFMRHLESVEESGAGRSRWRAKGPVGPVEWEATIIADEPGRVITWRSLEGSDVDNAGAVRFEGAPGGRGTIVRVNMQYNPIAGALGAAVAKLFGEEPEQQMDDDLRRFKQVMEVGEVVVSDATLLGTGYMEQRPGRPAAAEELEAAKDLPGETGTNYRSMGSRSEGGSNLL